MYIYHKTDIKFFVDILHDGYLRAGNDTKRSNYNVYSYLSDIIKLIKIF